MSALAIDIGGTKLAAAVVDDTGVILARGLEPTPRGADGDTVFAALDAAVHRALDSARIDDASAPGAISGVGVATAGPMDLAAGTVSPVNIPGWRDFPLRDELARRYGPSVRMFGDAVAVTVAEHWLGAARDHDNVLGMVMSTGIGGGLVLSGRVVPGSGGNAGHIGHLSIDAAGPACVCGGVGCLEMISSGTSIARWAAERTGDRAEPLDTAMKVADAARAGDEIARAALDRAADALGMAVAGAVTLLDLDLVVIGGGVMNSYDLIEERLDGAYRRYASLGYARQPRIVPAALGTDAGVLGAAAVIHRPETYWPYPT